MAIQSFMTSVITGYCIYIGCQLTVIYFVTAAVDTNSDNKEAVPQPKKKGTHDFVRNYRSLANSQVTSMHRNILKVI